MKTAAKADRTWGPDGTWDSGAQRFGGLFVCLLKSWSDSERTADSEATAGFPVNACNCIRKNRNRGQWLRLDSARDDQSHTLPI